MSARRRERAMFEADILAWLALIPTDDNEVAHQMEDEMAFGALLAISKIRSVSRARTIAKLVLARLRVEAVRHYA